MVDSNNLWKLSGDIQKYDAKTVIFLGDLFHSEMNEECLRFADFMANFEGVNWILVEGNHDILHPDFYKKAGIDLKKGIWRWRNLDLSHEPEQTKKMNVAGHIHPGVRIRGIAKQSMRLACFHLTDERMLMPAYGGFTGKYTIKPKKGDQIFVLTNSEVLRL